MIGDSYTSSNPGTCYGVTSGAFIWDRKHGMVDLGSFGGTCTFPNDINDHGQVAGAGFVSGDSYQRAFLWQNGSLRDLGGFEGNNTGAIAINEKGEAVGFAQHAALWRHVGQLTDLGTVGSDPCSFAQGINDVGQVVEKLDAQRLCALRHLARFYLGERVDRRSERAGSGQFSAVHHLCVHHQQSRRDRCERNRRQRH